MRDLMRDLALQADDAGAIVGNLGHECGGFEHLQELRPTVAGSRGGYGWAQWTGPRRRAFERYCREHGLDPASDTANYGFLLLELRGPERQAIPAVKRAPDLRAKVIAFERAYERAGVKHYDSRLNYATRAMAAFGARPPAALPANRKPLKRSRTMGAGGLAAGGGAVVAVNEVAQRSADHLSAGTIVGIVAGVLIIGAGLVTLYARWDDAGRPVPSACPDWLARLVGGRKPLELEAEEGGP